MHESLRDTAIVIPTYNERENIAALIEAIARVAGGPGIRVLVVDDNSPDGTGAAVEALAPRFPGARVLLRRSARGYGNACAEGLREALAGGPRFVLSMDADFSHAPEAIPKLVDALENADLAIGSRYVDEGRSAVANWPVRRLWMSRLANRYVNYLTGVQVHDATSGFRCWRAEALARVLDRLGRHAAGYALLPEMLYHAAQTGARITEVGSVYQGRTRGESKMSAAVVLESLWTPLRLRLTR